MEVWLFILLIVAGLALIVAGYVGSVLPAIPGPPLAWASLFILHFGNIYPVAWYVWLILTTMAVIVTLADYVIPILGTKRMGGTKYGTRGSTVGVILGVILTSWLGPLCIILGPFLGATVAEIYGGKTFSESVKIGAGALLGFLVGTAGKLVVVTFFLLYFIYAAVRGGLLYY